MLKHQDALAVHGYRKSKPETWGTDLSRLRKMMNEAGGPVAPIVITEFGYPGANCIGDNVPYFPYPWQGSPPDEMEQAAFLIRSYVVCLSNGVRQLFWYKWDESRSDNEGPDIWGLLRVYPVRQPKPALVAFNTMATFLDKVQNGRRINMGNSDVFVYHFERPDTQLWVAWTTRETPDSIDLVVDNVKSVEIVKMLGISTKRETSNNKINLLLTNEPIFIVPR